MPSITLAQSEPTLAKYRDFFPSGLRVLPLSIFQPSCWIARLGLEQHSWGLRSLLLGDLIFFVLHWLHFALPALQRKLFSVASDASLPEIYQGFKQLGIVGLLIVMGWHSRELRYGSWVLLFVYLFCDDLFRIHESQGDGIADWMDSRGIVPWLGLRSQDYGELIFLAIVFTILLGLIAACYWLGKPLRQQIQRRRKQAFRQSTGDLMRFLLLLSLFGVGIDFLHSLLAFNQITDRLLSFIEDGGEMLVVSLMTSYLAIAAGKIAKNRAYFR